MTGFHLRLADLPDVASYVVPLGVTIAALGYAAHRLDVQDVA